MTGSEYDDDPDVFRLPLGDRSSVRSTHEGRNFMFAVLRYVDMSEADFYWASFRYAVLEGAIMVRCDLRGASSTRPTCAGPIYATPTWASTILVA